MGVILEEQGDEESRALPTAMSTGRDSSLPPVTQNDMAMEVSM